MDIVLIILLILLLLGGGGYGYHAGWGGGEFGILGLVLVVILVAWLVRGRRGPLV